MNIKQRILSHPCTSGRCAANAFPCSRRWRKNGTQAAFTLVELLAVVAILAVLSLMALPAMRNYIHSAKNARAMGDIRTLDKEVNAYFIDKNVLPASLNDINRGTFLDPWGRPYKYTYVAGGGAPIQDFLGNDLNVDYDLFSQGPDGKSAQNFADPSSPDDIVRANDGSYVGLRY